MPGYVVKVVKEMSYTVKLLEPTALIIVGLDTPDRDHPLYDERVHSPIDPDMVENVRVHWNENGETGILEPVLCQNRGKPARPHVVCGRSRTQWAREVGCLVPVHMVTGSDADMIAMMIAENEVRTADNHMVSARKAERLMQASRTGPDGKPLSDKELLGIVARAFGTSAGTVRARLGLLTLAPELQTSVELGEIAMYDALALKELPHGEQVAAARAKAAAKGTGERVARVPGERARPGTRPGKREVIKLAGALGGAAQTALMWAIGECDEAASCEDEAFAAALAASRVKV